MTRDRILDSAAKLFAQYGYRLASMELVAQECGLTRQALYHHFESKEALFRAVVEAVGDEALEAERTAALSEERAGKGLADILAAQLSARYLYQTFNDRKFRLIVDTIERAGVAGGPALRKGLAPAELARAIELAARGFGLKKADDGALADLALSIRLMVAGAFDETPGAAKPRALRRRQ